MLCVYFCHGTLDLVIFNILIFILFIYFILELAAMIKERNRNIERLELSLEKAESSK